MPQPDGEWAQSLNSLRIENGEGEPKSVGGLKQAMGDQGRLGGWENGTSYCRNCNLDHSRSCPKWIK